MTDARNAKRPCGGCYRPMARPGSRPSALVNGKVVAFHVPCWERRLRLAAAASRVCR